MGVAAVLRATTTAVVPVVKVKAKRKRRAMTPREARERVRTAAVSTPSDYWFQEVVQGREVWPIAGTATPARACLGQGEPRAALVAGKPVRRHYPGYYVTHRVRFTVTVKGEGRQPTKQIREKPICDDCHNNEVLQQERRRLIDEGYVAAPDSSTSGEAIRELDRQVERNAKGELCAVQLEERDLLPEDPQILLAEIQLGVLAAEERAAYDEDVEKLGEAWDVALATAVDPAAVARLVAFATSEPSQDHPSMER